jgi:hypothetical protein
MMYRANTNEPLAGWWTDLKKATVNTTKKVGRVTKKALASVAKGACKASQSQIGQVGGSAAGMSPDPVAQGVSKGMQVLQAICPTADGGTEVVTDPALLQQMFPQPIPEPFYKNPYVIGGGLAAAAVVAYALLKK